MLNKDEILGHLYSLHTRGIKYDLAKITESCRKLGNPIAAYDSFHVAGTNGKGSTCTFLDAAIRSKNKSCGLYTSPHLVAYEERFLLDGHPVEPKQWLQVYADIAPLIDRLELTFFEASTLMAFELFRRREVEWAVLETGLGGRLDATNIVVPRVSVITSISMDHREYLGDTLVQIASEKLGIVKKDIPVIMALPEDDAVRQRAIWHCEEKNAPLSLVDLSLAESIEEHPDSVSFIYRGIHFRLPVPGRHQVENALLALVAFEKAGFAVDSGVAEAFRCLQLPGRFHQIRLREKTVVLDVAHNPAAAQALRETVRYRFGDTSLCAVIGVMKDKNSREFIGHLSPVVSEFICTAPETPRAENPDTLAGYAAGKNVSVASTVKEALERALQSECPVVLVTGSFFTVGEAFEAIGKRPLS